MIVIKHDGMNSGDNGFELDALLFDLDGTLIDSAEIYFNIMDTIFKKLEWPPVSRDRIRAALSSDGFDWSQVLPHNRQGSEEELIASARAVSREFYPSQFQERVQAIPGVDTLLRTLYSGGVKIGLVTSTHKEFLAMKMTSLRKCGVSDLFHAVVDLDDVEKRKPAPDPLLECAKRMDVRPNKCAYIGDTKVDIQASKAAGMVSIAVLSGVDDYQALSQQHPDFVLDTVLDLRDRLIFTTARGAKKDVEKDCGKP